MQTNTDCGDVQISAYKSQISELERNYIELLGFVETQDSQTDAKRGQMEEVIRQKTQLVDELTSSMEEITQLLGHTQQKL